MNSNLVQGCILFSVMTGISISRPIEPNQAGKIEVEVTPLVEHYSVLHRSVDLKDWRPIAVGANDETLLTDPLRMGNQGFYRVSSVPLSQAGDVDNDSISDHEDPFPLNGAADFPATSGSRYLASQADFDRLAVRDNFPGAQNVKEVKFLITDITTTPKLHFMNVNEHQFHYDFAREVLGKFASSSFWTGNRLFTNETYFTAGRLNLAGSLVSHENYIAPDGVRGLYTLEFWPTDPVQFQFIDLAYEMVAANAPFIDRLFYHAPSETQREIQRQSAAEFAASAIQVIDTDELFASLDYSPMNQEEAFGRLVLSTGSETLSARDIVIFRNLPNDLTFVSGIITEVPQTPLSHVNLKAQQNNTPNAFIANASQLPEIEALLGENVYYRVAPEGFEIRLATQEEVDDYFEAIRPTSPSFPPRDLSVQEIRPLSEIVFGDTEAFGGKATNVAELRRLFPANAPDGYAIPIYFYDEFMKFNGFYELAESMMAAEDFQTDPVIREERLKAFRRVIKKESSLPEWMTDKLTDLQNSFPVGITPRLRSSANAEDSVSFNGAGLYDSFTHKEDEGHITKSVLQVWASLWNYRAYEEREFYRISHLAAAMGILVHKNSKNEQANGVAVARNIFDPNWEGYYFNVQKGENLVTNPEFESVPEEMLVAKLATDEFEIQYIRSSNQVELGERVLTRDQVLEITDMMQSLNSRFRQLYRSSDSDFAMEIEFKIEENGQILIKQARPFVD